MCGIAGILALGGAPPTLPELRRMAGALHHRGPDEHGAYRDERCGLAHARLSIIDLVTGQQPLSNEDGTLWISFNGEIFNYVELREELERAGHRFRTHSDTEVIVHAWEEWGEAAFPRMNGQWAVALWDKKKRTLILSRDRVGVRPLYVAEHAGRLYFASELKAIFAADPTFPRRLDPRGIDETFTFWSIVPPQSVFEGVTELEPGTTMVIAPEGRTKRAYWEPTYPVAGDEAKLSIEEATEAVSAALERATTLRMIRADVPVGSYLSGGLDSSLVAALGLRSKGRGFQTYSLRFEDAEYDETAHQRTMVEHIGSEHHEVVCRKADIAAIFPRVVLHAERPILRTAPAPLMMLSELVRQSGIKVVLTGEGADEMFAGYDLFKEGKVRRFCARHPESKLRPRILDALYPYLARSPVAQRALAAQFFLHGLDRATAPGFAHDTRWRTTSALKRLYHADFSARLGGFDPVAKLLGELPQAFGRWSPLGQDQYLEIRTLLSGYLMSSQGDRMLMASSVEGRFPFLDKDVMELAARLPPSHKLHVLDEKHVLKRLGKGILPPSILARSKQPYRAPDALSFVLEPRPEYLEEVLSERAVAAAGVFDPSRVAQLWGKCKALAQKGQFSNADNMALVGVLSTQLLHRDLVAKPFEAREATLRTSVSSF
jgi:asparagine synthase (glutamine-hydrolysing)